MIELLNSLNSHLGVKTKMQLLELSKQVEQKIDERKNREKSEFTTPITSLEKIKLLNKNINHDFKEFFQERAAIREYEGEQSRVQAELGALEDVKPYLKDGNQLIIPQNSPQKYRWWQGGQSIEATLRELEVSEETIKRYVQDKAGGVPKPTRGID